MRVLFITNIPSPYRVDFFNELGKYCTLDVIFERCSSDERDKSWEEFRFINFNGVILNGVRFGKDKAVTWKILSWLRREYDYIIIANAATPVGILSIFFLKWKRQSYFIEGDGAQYVQRKGLKERLKRFVLGGATGYFSTSKELDYYYRMYGAVPERIYRYPFSSIHASEVQEWEDRQEKRAIARNELKISLEKKMVLAIGRFEHIKGFDLLIQCAKGLENNADIYIVGGTVTDEYQTLLSENKISNVYFAGFQRKKALNQYFIAADLFVLPTRYDPWGLVINEAMAFGLPVISTDKCVAAMELIENDINGYVVPADNIVELSCRVKQLINADILRAEMGKNNLQKIKGYTIEKMALRHMELLNDVVR